MKTVYIGVGSNLSDPEKQVNNAINALTHLSQSKVTAVSSLYASRPMGPAGQPNYVNAVVKLSTSLSPLTLLDKLQQLEHSAGRIRKECRWGARILDLDLLLYGNDIINNDRLIVPHYGMKLREFVLLPLVEIAPTLRLPDGENVKILADHIVLNGLAKINA